MSLLRRSDSTCVRWWAQWLIGLTAFAALVAGYPLSVASSPIRQGVLIGWSVSLVLSLSGGWLAFRSLSYPQRIFMLVAYVGMLVRLIVVAIAVVLAIAVYHLHVAAFLGGLLGAYTVYLALEIAMLYRCRPASIRRANDADAQPPARADAPEVAV